jgi:hypothetical protein
MPSRNLTSMHGSLTSRDILLIGKHQQEAVLHLPVAQDPMQLLPCLVYSVAVVAIDNKYQALRSGIVVPPERPNLILTSYVLLSQR